jgi:hypothetical protein
METVSILTETYLVLKCTTYNLSLLTADENNVHGNRERCSVGRKREREILLTS